MHIDGFIFIKFVMAKGIEERVGGRKENILSWVRTREITESRKDREGLEIYLT